MENQLTPDQPVLLKYSDGKEQIDSIISEWSIEEETAKEVAVLREQIEGEYQAKSDQLIDKLEIEKNIYREVIRDNILLAGNLNIDQVVSEKLI